MNIPRIPVIRLSLSAAGFVAILLAELYTGGAIIPTINDVWTYGFGSTVKEDGTPVKQGDKTTPPKAVRLSYQHIAKDEGRLKQCLKGDLHQHEYDILVDFSYQYGVAKTCNSSMVRHINAGRYPEACQSYLLYKYSGGYDCTTLINGQPNKRCWGVWTRNVERTQRCLEPPK